MSDVPRWSVASENPADAYRWYSKAAEPPNSNPEAIYLLGRLDAIAGVPPNGSADRLARAVELFKPDNPRLASWG